MYKLFGKRIFDTVVSAFSIIVLLPVFAVIAILVRVLLGVPILFRQVRPGRDEKPFTILKFRTMTETQNPSGTPLPDSMRLTPAGQFLRSTSLDELPELLNVLKGEMSLVGPRPLLMEYLARYTPEQRRRHEVLPGITGWAQVNGRNNLTWEEKFALDVWYVDHCSLWLDLKIILLTVRELLLRQGINQPGQVTVERFGSNQK